MHAVNYFIPVSILSFCSSVAKSYPTLCNPMAFSTPGFPLLHQLPELAQIHTHWVSDAIQPSCPLSSPSPPAFNFSQLQGLFQWVSSLHQYFGGQSIGASASASVLPMNIQGWFPLGLTDLISLQSKGLSRVFSNTTVQRHQFFSAQPCLWSNSHIHTWLLEKPQLNSGSSYMKFELYATCLQAQPWDQRKSLESVTETSMI